MTEVYDVDPDDRQNPSIPTKPPQCLEATKLNVAEATRQQVTINKRDQLQTEVLTFTFGGASAGDCRWVHDTVHLYSDGRWLHIHHFRSAADVFGDSIVTKMKVVDSLGYGIVNWKVQHGIDPGDNRTDEHQGRSDELIRLWDSIDGVIRSGSCE
jgi:hypothetical protein